MTILEMLKVGLEDGLDVAGALWWILSSVCVAGLAYMLGGHRLAVPGHMAINRFILCWMSAILVLSALYMALALYVVGQDRSYGLLPVMFVGTMAVPVILSAIGVLLWRISPFPRPR